VRAIPRHVSHRFDFHRRWQSVARRDGSRELVQGRVSGVESIGRPPIRRCASRSGNSKKASRASHSANSEPPSLCVPLGRRRANNALPSVRSAAAINVSAPRFDTSRFAVSRCGASQRRGALSGVAEDRAQGFFHSPRVSSDRGRRLTSPLPSRAALSMRSRRCSSRIRHCAPRCVVSRRSSRCLHSRRVRCTSRMSSCCRQRQSDSALEARRSSCRCL
jgi:hypothetical protein